MPERQRPAGRRTGSGSFSAGLTRPRSSRARLFGLEQADPQTAGQPPETGVLVLGPAARSRRAAGASSSELGEPLLAAERERCASSRSSRSKCHPLPTRPRRPRSDPAPSGRLRPRWPRSRVNRGSGSRIPRSRRSTSRPSPARPGPWRGCVRARRRGRDQHPHVFAGPRPDRRGGQRRARDRPPTTASSLTQAASRCLGADPRIGGGQQHVAGHARDGADQPPLARQTPTSSGSAPAPVRRDLVGLRRRSRRPSASPRAITG